jgi:hypothetical protein
MRLSFERTIFALAEAIVRDRCRFEDAVDQHSCATVAGFLLDQHRRMPDYLRMPFRCLTLLFDAWALPFTGRPFHRSSLVQRSRQIRAWRGSALGVRRDLVRFYESLAIFAWYSERSASDGVR